MKTVYAEPDYLQAVPADTSRDAHNIPGNCLSCKHRRGSSCGVYYKLHTACLTWRLERAERPKGEE